MSPISYRGEPGRSVSMGQPESTSGNALLRSPTERAVSPHMRCAANEQKLLKQDAAGHIFLPLDLGSFPNFPADFRQYWKLPVPE
jgi:hypothetical protein